MRITLVTGTRPQIIKSAPLIRAMESAGLEVTFVHTGQHYDYEMAAQFIHEFSVKEPDVNLDVGSGTSAFQIHEVVSRLSKALVDHPIDYMIVPGDTNSALGAALTGFKMDIPTCHLESGLRSYDMFMQEEVNRRLVDHGSAGLFAPTDTAVRNLEAENVRGSVFKTGDTMYDILKERLKVFGSVEFQDSAIEEVGVKDDDFAVLTLHRRENTDFPKRLSSTVTALKSIGRRVVFPMHPRTRKKLDEGGLSLSDNVTVVPPIPYSQMMALVSRASLLLTDSGGLQKEAYLLNTPCVTIRDNTEWVETIEAGANILAFPQVEDLTKKVEDMWGKKLTNDHAVYGDGTASENIVEILKSGEIEIKNHIMVK
ncbi:MAG: UDP-N-acetylglucosamine 2-epimerase (non-hydrolyzing) [Candidatus Thorarchaeota archaeon]